MIGCSLNYGAAPSLQWKGCSGSEYRKGVYFTDNDKDN